VTLQDWISTEEGKRKFGKRSGRLAENL
jgi:hypothetical protein